LNAVSLALRYARVPVGQKPRLHIQLFSGEKLLGKLEQDCGDCLMMEVACTTVGGGKARQVFIQKTAVATVEVI
jgi:hypothetical protein